MLRAGMVPCGETCRMVKSISIQAGSKQLNWSQLISFIMICMAPSGLFHKRPNSTFSPMHHQQGLKVTPANMCHCAFQVGGPCVCRLHVALLRLPNLKSLDISSNHLPALPDSFHTLSALTYLNVSHNKLSNLPDSIGSLTSLAVLDASNNQMLSLPESFAKLSSLSSLRLDANRFEAVPHVLRHLRQLETLSMANNKVTEFPEWMPRNSHEVSGIAESVSRPCE